MKKTTIITIILVLLVILISFIFFSQTQTQDKTPSQTKDSSYNPLDSNSNTDSPQTAPLADGLDNNEASTNRGGGSSGSGGSTGDSENPIQDRQIPSDMDTVECGFYFAEYGICAGTCQLGTCKSEGRSCYCQS